jgi:predicted dehydrogenase/nucleoside-diphosphate-sugar epimerase
MPESLPLRIAFVGTGRMAAAHLAALRRVPTAHQVGAACDFSGSRAQEFVAAAGAGARAYSTLTDLLENYRPDVVHVCTPRGRHFEPALEVLLKGVSVYVEKPFVETRGDARSLLSAARRSGALVCAGHQLVYDPVFQALMARSSSLGRVTQIDSHFAFRAEPRLSSVAQANILADVLPHPLYSLIAAMEHAGANPEQMEIIGLHANNEDLHALLRAGKMIGRLSVTLRGRPVASTLTITGDAGALTADFIRTTIVGSGNSGMLPLEKIFNPIVEGWQMISRTAPAVARRIVKGVGYPGLSELLNAFYSAVRNDRPSPVTPAHLLRVTEVYQELVERLPRVTAIPVAHPHTGAPVAVVTGARGFLGTRIAKHLAAKGYLVRGISRTPDQENPFVHEWIRADLAEPAAGGAFAGAEVVVHAASETAGGFGEHQRNSIGVARAVIAAMNAAGLDRLVYVSSLSVLEPALGPWRRLGDNSPLARVPRRLGPYAWGKTMAEREILSEAVKAGIQVRTLRPACLIDPATPELPGIVGRRLFGNWHLGMGRPGLRVAALDVDRCGAAIAWCAANFDKAPRVVNLFDPTLRNRKELLALFRSYGWQGRVVWVPISVLAGGITMARTALSLTKGRLPDRLDAWSILRPQMMDARSSRALFEAMNREHGTVIRHAARPAAMASGA